MNDSKGIVKPAELITLMLTAGELQVLVDAVEESILWLDSDPNLDSLVAKVYAVMDEVGRR